MATPHRAVDGVVDGVAGGVQSIVHSVGGGLKSAGSVVQQALDAPFKVVGNIQSPAHVPGRCLDGLVNGAVKASSDGVIGSMREVGHGVMRGLDHPVEQFGIPPDMGSGFGGFHRGKRGRY